MRWVESFFSEIRDRCRCGEPGGCRCRIDSSVRSGHIIDCVNNNNMEHAEKFTQYSCIYVTHTTHKVTQYKQQNISQDTRQYNHNQNSISISRTTQHSKVLSIQYITSQTRHTYIHCSQTVYMTYTLHMHVQKNTHIDREDDRGSHTFTQTHT